MSKLPLCCTRGVINDRDLAARGLAHLVDRHGHNHSTVTVQSQHSHNKHSRKTVITQSQTWARAYHSHSTSTSHRHGTPRGRVVARWVLRGWHTVQGGQRFGHLARRHSQSPATAMGTVTAQSQHNVNILLTSRTVAPAGASNSVVAKRLYSTCGIKYFQKSQILTGVILFCNEYIGDRRYVCGAVGKSDGIVGWGCQHLRRMLM